MKYSASTAMSSCRSRSGGTKIGITARRKYRSSRNSPLRIAAGRSLLVAAITRASTLIRCVLPTGSTTCSCSARSTLACVFRLMSPISSRKIVPPSAASNLPRRSDTAPVNAPRTWPNSSDSIRSSGIAAQFTSMNGPACRRLNAWTVRATSSLPVPFSPNTSTRPLVGAAMATCSRNCPIVGLSPIIVRRRSTRARRSRFSASSTRWRSALRTTSTVFSRDKRLFDEVEGAHLDGAHRRLDVAVARDQHDLRVDLAFAQFAQGDQAVHARQPDVEQDDVGRVACGVVEAFLAARRRWRRRSPRRAARPRGRCGRRVHRRR